MERTPPSQPDESQRLLDYLQSLQTAAEALNRARRLYPDFGLDHAVDRLRHYLGEGAQRLHRLEAKAAETATG